MSAAPNWSPVGFNADVVAVAKRDLEVNEILDGEGGYTVWGKIMPAQASIAAQALPIGLASDVKLTAPIKQGQLVTQQDIVANTDTQAWQVRNAMLRNFE